MSFCLSLQRKARVHRRRGYKARNAPSKIQFKMKRESQVLHVMIVIGKDFKSKLHFYIGSGVGRHLTQSDWQLIFEEVIAVKREKNWILVDGNDNAHRTMHDWAFLSWDEI